MSYKYLLYFSNETIIEFFAPFVNKYKLIKDMFSI